MVVVNSGIVFLLVCFNLSCRGVLLSGVFCLSVGTFSSILFLCCLFVHLIESCCWFFVIIVYLP